MLRFVHETRELPGPESGDEEAGYLAIQPLVGFHAQRYIGLTDVGDLFRIDLDEGRSVYAATVSDQDIVQPGAGDFRLSADGRFAAVFAPKGQFGAVCDPWGIGDADSAVSDGVIVFDVATGQEMHRLAGPPNAPIVFDEWRVSLGVETASVWDVAIGERFLSSEGFSLASSRTSGSPGPHGCECWAVRRLLKE